MRRECRWVVALTIGLVPAAQAQMGVNPFRTLPGPRLSATDTDLLLASVAKLNQTVPETPGASDAWSNPKTGSSGTSTLKRVFQSRAGLDCHEILHHIVVAGHAPGHDYRFTWCKTPAGEWKAK